MMGIISGAISELFIQREKNGRAFIITAADHFVIADTIGSTGR